MEARTQLVRDSRWSGVKGELTDLKALWREVEKCFLGKLKLRYFYVI